MRSTSCLASLLTLAACAGPAGDLYVDLRSDLRAGSEVRAVAVFVHAEGSPEPTMPVVVRPLFVGDALIDGLRVAEAGNLPLGRYRVRVALLDDAGATFVERPILVEVQGPISVTALVTRDCVGVSCADTMQACYGGACTDPRCTPETPETCTTECTSATQCPTLADCSAARCEDGLCLYDSMDTMCADTERCDVEDGCVPRDDCFDGLLCGRECLDPRTDVANCGGCNIPCPSPPMGGTAQCVDARCVIACDAGLVACGTECLASCETVYDAPTIEMYVVPSGCSELLVKAWGAGGGRACGAPTPGAGGYAQAVIPVVGGETLTVVVGGPGGDGAAGAIAGAGGTPGNGGTGGLADCGGGGGGGYSGVFRVSLDPIGALVVAGGGGGSGSRPPGGSPAGAGGGATGQDGQYAGSGGTQTSGGVGGMNAGRVGQPGAALEGGDGDTVRNGNDGGGAGGGGWFGGGATHSASTNAGGGGGGSSHAVGSAIVLVTGNRTVPGNDADPDRGTAGEPGQPGRVSLTCVR
ncbi:MAG: glycine-rich protein [Sandaracinaceae bacterium]